MANLLQTIQQNRQTLAQPQGVTDQTQQVQGLLAAKSGKAATGSDTGISNLGEQSAVATTNQQLGQQRAQNQIQTQAENTAATGIAQNTAIQKQGIAQQNQYNTVQNRIQTNQILQGLAQDKGTLDVQKKQAALEQVAFNLSMQDKQYTDTLQQIGQKRRLDNEANFRTEMQNVAFGDTQSILAQKLGTNDILSANDRDFAKAMGNLTIDDAMQIASIESSHAQTSADIENALARQTAQRQAAQANIGSMYGGLGATISGGLGAYSAYQKDQDNSEESE